MTALHVFGAALILSATLTPIAWLAARRIGFLDRPRGYKAHAAPTPLAGGVAVVLAALAAYLAGAVSIDRQVPPEMLALIAGAVTMLAAGLYDDFRALSPAFKLAWQALATLVAGVIAISAGTRLELFLGWPSPAMYALTLAWILVVTNAFNFLDNANGLCAGLAAIGATALGIVNLLDGQAQAAYFAFAWAGACCGFLPYNFPRARIFLGDAGAMPIGFGLAGLAVIGVYTRGAEVPGLALLAPVLALAIPLLDLALVTMIRIASGRAPWRGDRAHISHRLMRRGLRPAAAVGVLWLCAAVLAGLGLLAHTVPHGMAFGFVALLIVLLIAIALAAGWRGLD
ncbi:MAG: glycosyltransferase family 4 protein [Gammaproteobacteria bacterium]